MGTWFYGIAAMAVVLSLLMALLPAGGIRKTSMMGFAFVFLLTMTVEVKNLLGSGRDWLSSYQLELEWEEEKVRDSLLMGDAAYTEAVLEQYVDLLEQRAQNALQTLDGISCALTFLVDEDPESEHFAAIRTVHCRASLDPQIETEREEDFLPPVEGVSKIEISLDGIFVQWGEAPDSPVSPEQDPLQAQWEERVVSVLTELFLLESEQVVVHWMEGGLTP